jgi:hypothetical protein
MDPGNKCRDDNLRPAQFTVPKDDEDIPKL